LGDIISRDKHQQKSIFVFEKAAKNMAEKLTFAKSQLFG